jgi:nickel/cobalt transporter (NicO) family protein
MAAMSATSPALIAAAAGVGFGHAIMPDHWVPLAVIGRTRRYPLARVARLSGAAGVAHVLVSLVLGAIVIAVGLQFRSTIRHAQDEIVGGVLLATGVAFVLVELRRRGHGHSHEHHHHDAHGIAAVLVPFGAAASPDLTILPVFLAAAAVGGATAVGSLLAFAAATIVTIVVLTVLATAGGYQVKGHWLDRWANLVTAATLLVIGALVLAGVL